MSFVDNWQSGIVSSSTGGHGWISSSEVQTTRPVYWVDGSHTNTSDSNSGFNPLEPKATLASAISDANTGATAAIIVVDESHRVSGDPEALATTISQANIWVFGLGTGSTRTPLSRSDHTTPGTSPLLTVTGDGVVFRNFILYDSANGETVVSGPMVEWNGDYGYFADTLVMQGTEWDTAADTTAATNAGVKIGIRVGNGASATFLRVDNCYFSLNFSTGVSGTYGVLCGNAQGSGLRVTSCIFSGGSDGYDAGVGITAAVVGYLIRGCTFSPGGHPIVSHANADGIIVGNTATAGSQIARDPNSVAQWTIYPNGIVSASTSCYAMLRESDFHHCANVIWVNSATGSDLNTGAQRERPLATLAYALSLNADSGLSDDIIIIESGHTEVFTVANTSISSARLKIFGLGSGTSRPLFSTTVADPMFTLAAAGVELHGLRFSASTVAPTTYRVSVTAAGCVIEGCDFACGALDADTVNFGTAANGCWFENNTFTISANGPATGVTFSNSSASLSVCQNNTATGNASYSWTSGWLRSTTDSGLLAYANTIVNYAHTLIAVTNPGTHLAGNVHDDTSRARFT